MICLLPVEGQLIHDDIDYDAIDTDLTLEVSLSLTHGI